MQRLKAALAKKNEKSNNNGGKRRSSGDGASYPFWNIQTGESCTLRFLPDADETNDFFWRQREVIRLPFDGVVGGEYPTNDRVEVQVPCVDMFKQAGLADLTCPIIAGTRHLWKTDENLARTYWKKKSFIYQGFVVSSPFTEEEAPENPIRRFILGPKVHKLVEAALGDPDMEDFPCDYTGGTDFRITKGTAGQYADYGTSSYARKSRSLSETERAAIEKYKLFDLKEAMGQIPDADTMAAIKAMFEDSIAGNPYDAASFGKYFRAYGARGTSFGGGNASDDNADTASETVRESVEPKAEAATAKTSDTKDVLANIRARLGK
jgi:hypothetical protein